MAKACDASKVERYDNWIELQGDEKFPDYRFIARFKSYLAATTFEVFGNKASGYNRSCLMASDDEFEEPIEIPATSHSVYLIWAEGTSYYKIGKSTDIKKRLNALQTSCPHPIKLIHTIRCINSSMTEVEAALHLRYYTSRLRGEWFELDQDAVNYIKTVEVL
jgi:hypothetical protein